MTVSTVDIMLVTASMVVLMEAETSGDGDWVVVAVEGAFTIAVMVAGDPESVIMVESMVSVKGGNVCGGLVTVCVDSLVTTCVLGGAPAGWPPSTGTTE